MTRKKREKKTTTHNITAKPTLPISLCVYVCDSILHEPDVWFEHSQSVERTIHIDSATLMYAFRYKGFVQRHHQHTDITREEERKKQQHQTAAITVDCYFYHIIEIILNTGIMYRSKSRETKTVGNWMIDIFDFTASVLQSSDVNVRTPHHANISFSPNIKPFTHCYCRIFFKQNIPWQICIFLRRKENKAKKYHFYDDQFPQWKMFNTFNIQMLSDSAIVANIQSIDRNNFDCDRVVNGRFAFFSSHIPWHRSLDQNSEYQKPRSTVFWFRYIIHTYQQHRIVNICNFVYMNVVKVCHFRARTHQSIKYMIYFITQSCHGFLFNVSPIVSVMKFLVFWLTYDVACQ